MSSLSDLLLRTAVDTNYQTKGATLTFEELDGNLILLANVIRENIVDVNPGGVAAYSGIVVYSAGMYVTHAGNLWEYTNVTPSSGNVPGPSSLFWSLRSSGVLSHAQNTDTHTTSNRFGIGDDTAGNKEIFARNGAALNNEPRIRFNDTAGAWEFSNDGAAFEELGGGGWPLNGAGALTGDVLMDGAGFTVTIGDPVQLLGFEVKTSNQVALRSEDPSGNSAAMSLYADATYESAQMSVADTTTGANVFHIMEVNAGMPSFIVQQSDGALVDSYFGITDTALAIDFDDDITGTGSLDMNLSGFTVFLNRADAQSTLLDMDYTTINIAAGPNQIFLNNATDQVTMTTGSAAFQLTGVNGVLSLGGGGLFTFNGDRFDFNAPLKLGSAFVFSVPDATAGNRGALLYILDESGGEVPAFSDGTNWRRITDRAIIS